MDVFLHIWQKLVFLTQQGVNATTLVLQTSINLLKHLVEINIPLHVNITCLLALNKKILLDLIFDYLRQAKIKFQ